MICLGHVPQHLSIDKTRQLPPTHVLWEPQNRRSFACLTCRTWRSRCPLSMPSGSDPTQTVHKQMLLCYKSCLQEAVVGVVLWISQSQDSMNKLLEQERNTGLLSLNLPSQILWFIVVLDFFLTLKHYSDGIASPWRYPRKARSLWLACEGQEVERRLNMDSQDMRYCK